MKVFKPSDTSHILKVVPRLYVENITLTIRHELTDTTTTIDDLISFNDNGYLNITFDYEFKEGGSYEINCFTNTDLVWRGKAYATNDTDLENYKLL